MMLFSYFAFLLGIGFSLYLLILAFSYLYYYLHEPHFVLSYSKHSLAYSISHYQLGIGIWVLIGLLYVYLKCGGYEQQQSQKPKQQQPRQTEEQIVISKGKKYLILIWKNRSYLYCILLTIIFLHGYFMLSHYKNKNDNLCKQFQKGNNGKDNQSNSYDFSWPGWTYYMSDNYFSQTKQRLQHSRAKLMEFKEYENMIFSLKDLHDGIYSVYSWLKNHRLGYSMLLIIWRLVGQFGLTSFWVFSILSSWCFPKLLKKLKLFVFILIWGSVIIIGLGSDFTHSLILINNHSLCLAEANSGVTSIIINKKSALLIQQLDFNVVEDPNQIYKNVCFNMQKYFEEPQKFDEQIVINFLNPNFIGLLLIFLMEVGSLIMDGRLGKQQDILRQREDHYIQVEIGQGQ